MGAARYVAGWELPADTKVAVVIDVLRAFTTAAYAFAAGAVEIYLTASVEDALALGRSMPDALLMGENHGERPAGFHLSNSPVAASQADVRGKTLVQRTSAGTRAVAAAASVEHVFAASLVCASATASAVRRLTEQAPTYVISGRFQDVPEAGEDDQLTAELIERARCGDPLDADATATAVATSAEAGRTLALPPPHADPDDVAYATAVDAFDFAMRVERERGLQRLVALRPHAT